MARRPKGPGPASYRLLDWVARLGAAGIEPLRYSLGMSQAVAYSHIRRLVDAGYLWRLPINDGQGNAVAIGRAGANLAYERGIISVSPRSEPPSTGAHARGVSWMALRCETLGWEWLGPAEMRTDDGWRLRRADGARHYPDLGVRANGKRLAVEVELHAKAPRRVEAIMRAYRRHIDYGLLDSAIYAVTDDYVENLVRRRAEDTGVGAMLTIGRLATIVDDIRDGQTTQRDDADRPAG